MRVKLNESLIKSGPIDSAEFDSTFNEDAFEEAFDKFDMMFAERNEEFSKLDSIDGVAGTYKLGRGFPEVTMREVQRGKRYSIIVEQCSDHSIASSIFGRICDFLEKI